MSGKIVLVGLDGVPVKVIEKYVDMGIMPNMAELIRKGAFRQTSSAIPEVSSTAWSSIITGKNPGEHGIYGFTELKPNSYQLTFPNYKNLKASPFWDEWPGESVIINVPATYPVRKMNGAHISGFVSIDINKSVYPPTILDDIKSYDYRLDVDSRKAHESINAFLDDVEATLDARISVYRYLWNEYNNWQNFMLVFTGTDRLMHFLFDAFEDDNHRCSSAFTLHFSRIDKIIGEIASMMSEDDLLVLMSDHGFEKLDYDVYVNNFLSKNGYLEFAGKPGWENIAYHSKAFALDPARIYINLKDKYPQGSVSRSDRPKVSEELMELFAGWKVNGKKVVKDIYRGEDIYHGPEAKHGPDIVLVGNSGFNLKASFATNKISSKGIFTGKHTQDTSFALFYGLKDESILPENLSIEQIIPAIEKDRAINCKSSPGRRWSQTLTE
ncbi:alkaline phosphatase family protein [Sedimentisphaera salicampi]|uniref:alkaline phosphatase family protein n=1 Tax=Sedimentisphaera salicampi TaxID=1941349 RepID=UPI000B9BCF4D|nr:alkaline phosphatase family protein [Sedimentisphaera salicampi]OXU14461.1 phosphonoacetate hydrolase [Sedimentisphaera salicampi]